MSWEETVRNFFSKQPLSFNSLLEMLHPLQEKGKNQTLEDTIGKIEDMGFNTKVKNNTIKVLVPNAARQEVMDQMRQVFEPLGFEYDALRGGSLGRLLKMSKEGNAFILVKPESSAGKGHALGMEYEEKLANHIIDQYGQYGIKASTAGFSHGSDLVITGPTDSMSIELKTSSGADFGQFRLFYSPTHDRWVPAPTVSYKKNEALFSGLFKEFLESYLNQMAKFPDLNDPRVKHVKGFVTGLEPHPQTGEYRRDLQKQWFRGKNALIVSVDAESISSYYEMKGDRFIQIGRRGLYAFDPADAQKFGCSLFDEKIKQARLRFRLKPGSGENGHHSFTVAVKMLIQPSEKNLDNEEDLHAVIEELL